MAKVITEKQITKNLVSPDSEGVFYTNAATQESFASTEKVSTSGKTVTATTTFNAASTGKAKAANVVNLEGFANVEIDDRYVSSVIGGTHKITETVKTTYSDKALSEVASTTTTKQESSNATGAAKLTGGTYKIDSLADANGVVTPETAVTYDNLTLKDATAYNAAGVIYGGRSSVKTTETVTGASTSTTSSKTYTASGSATFENAKIIAENLEAGEEVPGVLYGYRKVTVTGAPAGANAVSVGQINSINTTRSSKVESSFVEDATFAYAEAGKIANTSSATVNVTDATVGEIAGASTLTLDGATAGTLNSETFTTTAAESIVAVQTGDAASAVTYKNTTTTRSQPSGRLTATGSTIGEMAFSQRIVKLDDTVANGFSDSGSSTVKTTRNVSWTADESVQNDADAYRTAAEEIEVGSENMTSYLVEKSTSVTHSGSLTAAFSIADDANAIGAVDGYRTVELENVGAATVYGADNGKVSESVKRTQSASGRSTTVKNSGSKYADGRLEATGSNITVGDADREAFLSSITLTDTTVDGFSARGLKATSSKTVSENVTFAKDEDGAYDKSLTAAKASFSATTSHKVTSNGKFEMAGGAITGDAALRGYKTITLEGVDMGDATFVDNNGLSGKNVLRSQNVAVKALTGDTDLIADDTAGLTLFGNVKGSFTQQGEQVSANWSASYAKKTGGSYSQTAVYDVAAGEVKGAKAGTISDYAKVALENVSADAVENHTLDVRQTVKYATKVTKDGTETTTDVNTTTATYTAAGKLTAASTFLGETIETKSIGEIAGVKDVVLENVSLTGGAKLNGNMGVNDDGTFVENDDGRNVTVVTDAVLGDETVAYTTDGSFKASNTAAWFAAGADLAKIEGDVKGFKKVTLENIDAKSVTGGNDDLYAAGTFKAISSIRDDDGNLVGNTIDGEISGYKSVTIDGYTVTGDITATFETGKTYGTAEISNATLGGSLVSGYSFVSFKNVASDLVAVTGQGGTGSYFDAGSKDNRVAAYGLINQFETVSLYATVTGAGDARNYSQTIGTIHATNAALAVEVVDKTLATDISQSINALFANAVVITSASKVRTDESGAALDNCGSVTINNLVAYSQTKSLTVQADIATTISALIGSKADDTLTFNATGILNLDKAGFGEGTDRIVLNLGEEETFNLVGDTVFADYKELAAKIKSTGLEAFAGTGKVVISNIAASETFDKDLKAALDAAGVAYSAGIKFESAVAAVPKMETIGSTLQTINGYEVRDFIQIAKKGSDCLNSDITLKGGDDTLSFSDDLEWRITGRTAGLDFGAGIDRVSTYTFTQGPKDAKGNYPEPEKTGEAHTVSLTDAKTFANSTLYIASSDALENEFYVSNVEKYDGQFKFKTDATGRTLKVATDTTMQTEGNAKGEIDNTVNAGKEVTATSLVFDSNAAEIGLAKGQVLEAKGFTSVQFKELDGVSGLGANAGRVAVYGVFGGSVNSASRTFEKVAEADVPVQSADVTRLALVGQTFTGKVTDRTLKITAMQADATFAQTTDATDQITKLTNGIITADAGSSRFILADFNGVDAGERVVGDIASASRLGDGTTMVQTVKALKATETEGYTGILMKTEADAEATKQIIVAKGATAAADDLFTSEAITLTKGTISNLEAGNTDLKTIKTDKVQKGTNVTTTAANKIVAANLNETMGLEVTVTDGNEFAIAGAGEVISNKQDGVIVSTSDWNLNDGLVKATINEGNKITISSGSKGTALFEKVQEVTFVANDKVAIVDDEAKAKAVDFSASGAEAKTAYVKTNNFELTGDAKAQYGEDMGATVSGDGVKAMIDGKSVTLNANSAAATLTDAMSVEFIKGSGDKVILDKAGNVTTSKVGGKTVNVADGQGFTLGKEAIAQDGDVVVKNVDQTLTSGVHANISDSTVTLRYGSEAADLTKVQSVEFMPNTDNKVTLTEGADNVTTSKVDDKTVYLGEKSFEITNDAVAAYATGSATAAGNGLAGKFKVYDTDKQSFVWAENGDKKYAAGTFTNLEKIVFHEPEEEHLFEGSIEAKSVDSVDALAADGTTTVKTTGLSGINWTFEGIDHALSTIENTAKREQEITLTKANGFIKNAWDAKKSTVKGTDYVNAKLGIDADGNEYVKDFTDGKIEVVEDTTLASVAFNADDKITGSLTGATAATKKVTVEKDKDFAITGAVTAAYKLATAKGDGLAGKFQTYPSNQHAFVWGGDYKAGEFTHVEKIVFHEKVPEDDYESSIEATSVFSVSDLSDKLTCTVTTAGLKAVNTTYPGTDGKTLSTIDNAAAKGDKIALSWANGLIKNTWTVTAKDDTTSTVEGTGNVIATLGINSAGGEYVMAFTQGTVKVNEGASLTGVSFSTDEDSVTGTISGATAADKTAYVGSESFTVYGAAVAKYGDDTESVKAVTVKRQVTEPAQADSLVVKAKIDQSADGTTKTVTINNGSTAYATIENVKRVNYGNEDNYVKLVKLTGDFDGWTVTASSYDDNNTVTVEKIGGESFDGFVLSNGVNVADGNVGYKAHNTGIRVKDKTLTVTGPDPSLPPAIKDKVSYADGISGAEKVVFASMDLEAKSLTTYGSVSVSPTSTAAKPLQTADYHNEKTLVVGSDYAFTIKDEPDYEGVVGAAYSVDDKKIGGTHVTNAIRATGDGVMGQFADKESITLLKDSAAATITDVKVVAFGTDADKVTFDDKQATVTTSVYADKTVISSTMPTSVFTISGDAKVAAGTMSVSGDGVTAKLIANEKVFFESGMTVMAKLTGVKGIVVGGSSAVTCDTAGNIQEASAEKAKVGTDEFTIGFVSDYTIVNGEDEVSVKGAGVKAKLDGRTLNLSTGSAEATVTGVTAVSVDGLSKVESAKGLTKAGLTGATVAADKSFEIKDATYEVTQNGTAKVKGNGVKASLNEAAVTLNAGSAEATLTKAQSVTFIADDKVTLTGDAADFTTSDAATKTAYVGDNAFEIAGAAKASNGTATVAGDGLVGRITDSDVLTLGADATLKESDGLSTINTLYNLTLDGVDTTAKITEMGSGKTLTLASDSTVSGGVSGFGTIDTDVNTLTAGVETADHLSLKGTVVGTITETGSEKNLTLASDSTVSGGVSGFEKIYLAGNKLTADVSSSAGELRLASSGTIDGKISGNGSNKLQTNAKVVVTVTDDITSFDKISLGNNTELTLGGSADGVAIYGGNSGNETLTLQGTTYDTIDLGIGDDTLNIEAADTKITSITKVEFVNFAEDASAASGTDTLSYVGYDSSEIVTVNLEKLTVAGTNIGKIDSYDAMTLMIDGATVSGELKWAMSGKFDLGADEYRYDNATGSISLVTP